jgi:predicted dehydrogenase
MNTPGGTFKPEIPQRSKFGSPWQYFANCVEKKKQPFIDGEEGARSLEVILAAYQSVETGSIVSLPLPRK